MYATYPISIGRVLTKLRYGIVTRLTTEAIGPTKGTLGGGLLQAITKGIREGFRIVRLSCHSSTWHTR